MSVNNASTQTVRLPRKLGWFRSWTGLVRWSLLRHKYLLPVFTAVQALFAVAVIYGLALLIPDIDSEAARYLSSGAWTLGIIAVGCVLAPQITGSSKQEGLLDYQRTLPVPRSAILLADAAVWSLAALPGIAVGMLAAAFRFGVDIQVDALTVAAVLGAQFTMVSIGYAIAFWLPLNATSLVTQIIMIGGLLFTPITFPAERLPEWAVTMHQFLPFAPIGNLIREATFRAGDPQLLNLVAAVSWAVAAYTVAYLALRKRS
ncbi:MULTISPECIES: ABC transporter permease [Auritidibacter]|uniref:ABC transporter permease n=1 Tax=Auritidibacter TaxID=1160973 RepID=UPI000D727538|nr:MULTISPECIES: ABC transporter permease [Auritidibacter]PXA81267.1 ABC transporter [Auritidibacter sp. NML120779]AXR73641.1 ABC transporter permease [Auritidibacter sp. NML130574]NIH70454.1 ABC-2 type transport system permease protein [Auritidibacter ignavus]PXA81435.1 ABC transporter [Auritidibacter sp. NML120636]RMX23676.1 ABC transporter permease [Auritidibacter ignavus]